VGEAAGIRRPASSLRVAQAFGYNSPSEAADAGLQEGRAAFMR